MEQQKVYLKYEPNDVFRTLPFISVDKDGQPITIVTEPEHFPSGMTRFDSESHLRYEIQKVPGKYEYAGMYYEERRARG